MFSCINYCLAWKLILSSLTRRMRWHTIRTCIFWLFYYIFNICFRTFKLEKSSNVLRCDYSCNAAPVCRYLSYLHQLFPLPILVISQLRFRFSTWTYWSQFFVWFRTCVISHSCLSPGLVSVKTCKVGINITNSHVQRDLLTWFYPSLMNKTITTFTISSVEPRSTRNAQCN